MVTIKVIVGWNLLVTSMRWIEKSVSSMQTKHNPQAIKAIPKRFLVPHPLCNRFHLNLVTAPLKIKDNKKIRTALYWFASGPNSCQANMCPPQHNRDTRSPHWNWLGNYLKSPTHTHVHSVAADLLRLDVGLLSYSVGNLLAVVVFFLSFGQLLHWLLQLCLNAAQLIYCLWKGKKTTGICLKNKQNNMKLTLSKHIGKMQQQQSTNTASGKKWPTHLFKLLLLVQSNSLSGLWYLTLVIVAYIEPGLAHLDCTF